MPKTKAKDPAEGSAKTPPIWDLKENMFVEGENPFLEYLIPVYAPEGNALRASGGRTITGSKADARTHNGNLDLLAKRLFAECAVGGTVSAPAVYLAGLDAGFAVWTYMGTPLVPTGGPVVSPGNRKTTFCIKGGGCFSAGLRKVPGSETMWEIRNPKRVA